MFCGKQAPKRLVNVLSYTYNIIILYAVMPACACLHYCEIKDMRSDVLALVFTYKFVDGKLYYTGLIYKIEGMGPVEVLLG